MNLVIRTQGDPANLAAAVRTEVQAIDPNQPVAAVRTMDQWVERSVAAARYRTALLGLLALVALVLASTGIYGVMSYSVSQRTHEIGVRMALGATTRDVLKLTVGSGLKLAGLGIAIGLGLGFAAARFIEGALFGVVALEPALFVAITALLTTVALLATLLPARHAISVDPAGALRD